MAIKLNQVKSNLNKYKYCILYNISRLTEQNVCCLEWMTSNVNVASQSFRRFVELISRWMPPFRRELNREPVHAMAHVSSCPLGGVPPPSHLQPPPRWRLSDCQAHLPAPVSAAICLPRANKGSLSRLLPDAKLLFWRIGWVTLIIGSLLILLIGMLSEKITDWVKTMTYWELMERSVKCGTEIVMWKHLLDTG